MKVMWEKLLTSNHRHDDEQSFIGTMPMPPKIGEQLELHSNEHKGGGIRTSKIVRVYKCQENSGYYIETLNSLYKIDFLK